jgi:UTP--glucose-1-phosphate uridylyltransferase
MATMNRVRAAIVPAAGLGTRLLPATLATSKELLPLGTHPAVCALVAEAVHAGLEELIVVVGPGKEDLRRFLDPSAWRAEHGRPEVERLRALLERVRVRFVEQLVPVGALDAIERGAAATGWPCAILFPDLVQLPDQRGLVALLEAHAATGQTVYGLHDAPSGGRHGPTACVRIAGRASGAVRVVSVEAPSGPPARGEIRTTFAAVHTAEFVHLLDEVARPIAGGPLDDRQLVGALDRLAGAGRLSGVFLPGEVLDLGVPAGYLDAAARFATGRARLVDLTEER